MQNGASTDGAANQPVPLPFGAVAPAAVGGAWTPEGASAPRAFKMKYTTETSASQGMPTIHEMRQVSLSRPMVTSKAHSNVKPAICTKGNQGIRTGKSSARCLRRKLK